MRCYSGKGIGLPKQAMAGTRGGRSGAKRRKSAFPVAIKLIAAEVVHKTESGAVVLGLKSAEEVQAEGQKLLTKTLGRGAFVDSRNGARHRGADRRAHRSTVRSVSDGRSRRHFRGSVERRFDPFAAGGRARSARDAQGAGGYKVLEGVRGQKPRDVDALVKAMVGLSDIFAAHRNHLSDMEINPIMVRAQGAVRRRWMSAGAEIDPKFMQRTKSANRRRGDRLVALALAISVSSKILPHRSL